jgi:uncharacterized membrane protein YdbT with pleckstrin-like domain
MPQVLYEASPSMVRMNPFGTALAVLLLLSGLVLALPPVAGALLRALPLPGVAEPTLRLAGAVLAALSVLTLLVWYIRTKFDRLTVREGEIIWAHGLLNKQYTEINTGSVRTVRVNQSILQRLLGAGDVKVFTSGDLPEVVVRGLPNPGALRNYIKGDAGTV